jgi:hypothetical protein
MNKFEQLVEYVINDETEKARELFHEIVVEKSRNIYEEMMEDEELDEAKEEDGDEELDEAKEEDGDEELDESLGGDQADDLIDDVEAEEQGMSEGDEEAEFDDGAEEIGTDVTHDIEGEHDEGGLEDRVVDLEDKLDELMAEFESLMGDEAGEAEHADMDAMDDMDAEEVADDEFETEGMMENVTLKAVAKPSNPAVSSKSVVAANSGAKGAMAKPVHPTGTEAQGRPAPTAKDAIGKVGNTPAQSTQKPTPATKPSLGQAAGVNTKSVIQ